MGRISPIGPIGISSIGVDYGLPMMLRPRIEHEHERQTVNAERFLAAPGFSR